MVVEDAGKLASGVLSSSAGAETSISSITGSILVGSSAGGAGSSAVTTAATSDLRKPSRDPVY